MLQIAASLPTATAGAARPLLLAAQSGTSNFALAMSSLLVPGAAPAMVPGEAPTVDAPFPGLQLVAEPGKELPEIGLDLSGDEEAPEQNAEGEDDAAAGEDLPFAWFAVPAPPVPDAAPVAPAVVVPSAIVPKAIVAEKPKTAEIVLPGAVVPDVPVAAQPKAEKMAPPAPAKAETAPVIASVGPKSTPVPPRVAERPIAAAPRVTVPADTDAPAAAPVPPAVAAAPPVPVPIPAPASATPAAAPAVAIVVQAPPAAVVGPVAPQPTPRIDAPTLVPVRDAAPVANGTSATRIEISAPAAQPAPQPAAERAQTMTIASLIAQASAQTVTQPIAYTRLRRSLAETDQPVVTSVAAPSAAALQQVTATPDAQQGTLDMRRHEWVGKMVETIEAMREAAPVKETRISLVPDALGKVDISVRQDGDRVHVHFAAETQAARQILTDAQPRLAEIAEQRGIRLGQTSVDSQSAGAQSGQRQQDAPRPQNPSAPTSARAAKDQLTATDERVA